MFPIASQTAAPIGLNFLWTLMGGRGCYRLKKFKKKFYSNFFFHGQRRALQLVYIKIRFI